MLRLWSRINACVLRRIGEERYNTWARSVRPVRIEEDRVVISYRTSYLKDKHDPVLNPLVVESVREATNRNTGVSFTIDDALFRDIAVGDADAAVMTFAGFLVGEHNRSAWRAARRFIEGEASGVLVIHGKSGLGKTHLLRSIRHEANGSGVVSFSCEFLRRQYAEAVRNGRLESFRGKCRGASILLIDDLHLLSHKREFQGELFDLLEGAAKENRRVAVACDRAPGTMGGFEREIRNRLESGVVAGLGRPDEAARLAFLRTRESTRKVPDGPLEILAREIDTNHKDLLQCLGQLQGVDESNERAAWEIVERFRRRWGLALTMEDVARETASVCGVKMADLASKNRGKEVTAARHVCFYLSRSLLNAPLAEIGRQFGGRSHSAVLQGCCNIEKNADRNTTRVIRKVEKTLSALRP